jgi:hypothetical protein
MITGKPDSGGFSNPAPQQGGAGKIGLLSTILHLAEHTKNVFSLLNLAIFLLKPSCFSFAF